MNLQQAIEQISKEMEGSENGAHAMETGYSGRGMYGKRCPAIAGSWSECQQFVAEVIKHHMNEHIEAVRDAGDDLTDQELQQLDTQTGELNELVDTLWDFSTDQLGMGIVMYWPHEEFVLEVGVEEDETTN